MLNKEPDNMFFFWNELYTSNPDLFERLRKRYLEFQILKITDDKHKQWRLLGVQNKVDKIRSKYKNSLKSASMIYGVMLDSFNDLNDKWNEMK